MTVAIALADRVLSLPPASSALHLANPPTASHPRQPQSFYCLRSFAFSRMSHRWIPTVRGVSQTGLFHLAYAFKASVSFTGSMCHFFWALNNIPLSECLMVCLLSNGEFLRIKKNYMPTFGNWEKPREKDEKWCLAILNLKTRLWAFCRRILSGCEQVRLWAHGQRFRVDGLVHKILIPLFSFLITWLPSCCKFPISIFSCALL